MRLSTFRLALVGLLTSMLAASAFVARALAAPVCWAFREAFPTPEATHGLRSAVIAEARADVSRPQARSFMARRDQRSGERHGPFAFPGLSLALA